MLEGKPVLAQIYRDGLVTLPSGHTRSVERTGVARQEGQRIYELVLRERPQIRPDATGATSRRSETGGGRWGRASPTPLARQPRLNAL